MFLMEMEKLVLERRESGDEGTFGRLLDFYTLELPWRENVRSYSAIPEGEYPVVWEWSPRFKRQTFRLRSVPGRDGILIHSANLAGDSTRGFRCQLNGCIALGERLGWIEGQKAVLLSKPAILRFEELMKREAFTLEVKNA